MRTATALADPVREPVRLLVVTDGAQAVREGEPVQAGKATVTGAVLTIPQEYPGWSCRLLDLAPVDAGDPAALERAARTVADELAAWPAGRTWWRCGTGCAPCSATGALRRRSPRRSPRARTARC